MIFIPASVYPLALIFAYYKIRMLDRQIPSRQNTGADFFLVYGRNCILKPYFCIPLHPGCFVPANTLICLHKARKQDVTEKLQEKMFKWLRILK